jgi:hypothetical protein
VANGRSLGFVLVFALVDDGGEEVGAYPEYGEYGPNF